MMTAMAASSFPSLEADDDCGECLLAFAAPCMICSESESAWPELPFPPREVVAAVRLGPAVFLLAKEVSVCMSVCPYVRMSVCPYVSVSCYLFTITPHSLLRSCSTSAMAVARLSLCDSET